MDGELYPPVPSQGRHSTSIPLDTPDDSPASDLEETSAPSRRPPPLSAPLPSHQLPYPSPPPSPCQLAPPLKSYEQSTSSATPRPEQPTLSQDVPSAVMQGYISPPSVPLTRTSYPPAAGSRVLPPTPPAAKHLSTPLSLSSAPYILPTLQNDLFSTGDSPYPTRRRPDPDTFPRPPEIEPAGLPYLTQGGGSPRPRSTRSTPNKRRSGGPPSPSAPLAPPQPVVVNPADVCVECMMRDRDMVDVDVLGPGVWDRASDVDFYEALREEEANERKETERLLKRKGSLGSGSRTDEEQQRWSSARSHTPDLSRADGASSRESASLEHTRSKGRRIGRGHELTAPALKLWTSMKPPASSHRWKTLQAYLKEQNRLLALERAGQAASEMERDRLDSILRERSEPGTPRPKRKSFSRNRSSTLLPSGITVERVDIHKDEKEAKSRWKASQKDKRRRASASTPSSPFPSTYPYASHYPGASSSASLRSVPLDLRPPSMPAASPRRFSSPLLDSGSPRGYPLYTRSSADLRSTSPSPSARPSSLAPSERPRSYFARGPRSATASVLSFAPSGSMIDMHLGLSQDKHLPARPDDDLLIPGATGSDDEGNGPTSTKKKRRTLGKILSRLHLRSAPPSPAPQPAFSPRASVSVFATSPDEEGPLEPPFPSYLAGDPALHRRSPTVSTASTSPVTPDLSQLPPTNHSSQQLPLRREKSLPALPVDLDMLDPNASTLSLARPGYGMYERSSSAPAPTGVPTMSRISGGYALGPSPSNDSMEHIGGRKAKAAKVSSRNVFAFWRRGNGGQRGRSETVRPYDYEDPLRRSTTPSSMLDMEKHYLARPASAAAAAADDFAPHFGTLDAVVRDVHFVATRYPSVSP